MYDTNIILNKPKMFVTKEDILNKITTYDIFRKYLGDFKIGKVYNSPLREDKSPSFGVFVSSRDNELLYKDLANNDCGDAFKFVKKLRGISTYAEVFKTIYEEMNLSSPSIELNSSKKTFVYKRTKISVTRKRISKIDIDFWSKFGISTETLKLFKVYPISKLFINDKLKDVYSDSEPMYAYKVFDKFKIYKPLSNKLNKWRGNLSILDIHGFEQLPEKGDLLILTKSLKDVMVLYELGYDSVAPASETVDIPEIVINNLKQRFKKIVVLYDRDATGVRSAYRIVRKYALEFMLINKKYKTKDISDYVKKYSLESAAEMLKKELKR